ncbi:MAG: nucleotide pyrophosphohydrolase [Myxococcota bacterium]
MVPDRPKNLEDILDLLRAFVAERDWAQFHDPKNLVMALASEVGELTALFRWVAGTEADGFAAVPANREKVGHEMADVAICLLLLADRLDVDLLDAVARKIELNAKKYPPESSRGRAERPSNQSGR